MSHHVTCRWLLLLCTCIAGTVQAAENSRAVVSPLATLGKLAVALLIVLVVFYVFARVMRQLQGTQGGLHSGLKIVGALSLGQREKVVVVQAGDKQLVLGVTSTQVNTLHVLEQPLPIPGTSVEIGDFRQKLSAALKRQVAN